MHAPMHACHRPRGTARAGSRGCVALGPRSSRPAPPLRALPSCDGHSDGPGRAWEHVTFQFQGGRCRGRRLEAHEGPSLLLALRVSVDEDFDHGPVLAEDFADVLLCLGKGQLAHEELRAGLRRLRAALGRGCSAGDAALRRCEWPLLASSTNASCGAGREHAHARRPLAHLTLRDADADGPGGAREREAVQHGGRNRGVLRSRELDEGRPLLLLRLLVLQHDDLHNGPRGAEELVQVVLRPQVGQLAHENLGARCAGPSVRPSLDAVLLHARLP
mmetsp:Transcript_8449/g.26918  ORF Transcript_8449/g.26918 Transcript_8449/m.26918 type:complete len:275 (-) Transcript_8449:408-1232(-)